MVHVTREMFLAGQCVWLLSILKQPPKRAIYVYLIFVLFLWPHFRGYDTQIHTNHVHRAHAAFDVRSAKLETFNIEFHAMQQMYSVLAW